MWVKTLFFLSNTLIVSATQFHWGVSFIFVYCIIENRYIKSIEFFELFLGSVDDDKKDHIISI